MPYQIPGFDGTFYAPGERKNNRWVVWRGRADDGAKIEIATDARDPAGAQRYVRRHLEERSRRRPPPAGAEDVSLATVDRHYRAERGIDELHSDWKRLEFIVARDGALAVRGINNAAIKASAEAWLEMRRREVSKANAVLVAQGKRPRHKIPAVATANREVITPYRALVHFAHEQKWCEHMVVHGLTPPPGSLPPAPPAIAEDETILKLLEGIEARIENAPTRWTRNIWLLRRAFVWLVHERGYRIGEWMRFDWAWVDLPAARARMALTKNKHDLRWEEFELSPTAVAFLGCLEVQDQGRIFPWHSRSNVYKWTDDVLKPIGRKWRPHDSRRAIVSHIVASTGDYKQAGRYVGHASERTTFRYRILQRPELAPAIRFARKA